MTQVFQLCKVIVCGMLVSNMITHVGNVYVCAFLPRQIEFVYSLVHRHARNFAIARFIKIKIIHFESMNCCFELIFFVFFVRFERGYVPSPPFLGNIGGGEATLSNRTAINCPL